MWQTWQYCQTYLALGSSTAIASETSNHMGFQTTSSGFVTGNLQAFVSDKNLLVQACKFSFRVIAWRNEFRTVVRRLWNK